MRILRIVGTGKGIHNYGMDAGKIHNTLGRTGIRIPELIFGSSALGNLYRELDDESKRNIVEGWFKASPSPVCVDSAGKYGAGLALEEIGKALRHLGIPDQEIVISNKLGWKRVPLRGGEPSFEPGIWKNLRHDAKQSIGYEGILECWEQGNTLLGEGYTAQMLSVHDPDEYLAAAESKAERAGRFRNILEAYRALEDLKSSGDAAAIGIGSKDWRVIREVLEKVALDWIMLADSLTIYTHPGELLSFIAELEEKGVYVINSALFNSGFLVGGSYFDYKPVDSSESPELFRWRENFNRVCRQFAVNPAKACIEFGLAPRAVKSIAMNTTRPERIAENVRSLKYRAPREFWESLLEQGLISVTPEQLR
jgi:D-threo-aldose 1-dehydrogenase